MMRILSAFAILVCLDLVQAAEQFKVRYFYDEDSSSLTILDLQFPSAARGVAVGFITEQGGNTRPVAIVTNNGGQSWEIVRTPATGHSLFFLNETLGWLVTEKGIWQTSEAGRNWKKTSGLRRISRVCFVDEKHGWAVGYPKAVYETRDGGKEWKPVPAAAQPKTTREFTTYHSIDFLSGKVGVIAGASKPPRRGDSRRDLPDWMEPEKARKRREVPVLSVLLETRDGGQTWSSSEASLFGTIDRLRVMPAGCGLALIRFSDAFAFPSEVLQLDWVKQQSMRVFRRNDRDITDVALLRSGRAYLAGIEPPGTLPQSPIPGKLKILRSDDWAAWQEIDVDYRATAHRAILAASDDRVWVATDTGMILQLAAN